MEKSGEAKPCKKQCGSLYSHRSPRAFERCSHLVEMTFAFIVTPFESAEWLRKIYKKFSRSQGVYLTFALLRGMIGGSLSKV